MTDFTEAEAQAIRMMMRASTTLPDDFWAVAAVQSLACIYARIEALLTEADKSMLIGIGGYIAHIGKTEMTAEIEAKLAIAKARDGLAR